MPGFNDYMKNLSERLQEQHQAMADAAHARGEKSPMERLFENVQQTLNAEQLRKIYEEHLEENSANL